MRRSGWQPVGGSFEKLHVDNQAGKRAGRRSNAREKSPLGARVHGRKPIAARGREHGLPGNGRRQSRISDYKQEPTAREV